MWISDTTNINAMIQAYFLLFLQASCNSLLFLPKNTTSNSPATKENAAATFKTCGKEKIPSYIILFNCVSSSFPDKNIPLIIASAFCGVSARNNTHAIFTKQKVRSRFIPVIHFETLTLWKNPPNSLSMTLAIPCSIPHRIKVQAAPCQIPLTRKVRKTLR